MRSVASVIFSTSRSTDPTRNAGLASIGAGDIPRARNPREVLIGTIGHRDLAHEDVHVYVVPSSPRRADGLDLLRDRLGGVLGQLAPVGGRTV